MADEQIKWILENKEWLFKVIIAIASFIFGRKSVSWNFNFSRITNNFIIQKRMSVGPDYKRKIELTTGASGVHYTMPDNGFIVVTAGSMRILVNDTEMASFAPSAKEQTGRVLVNKGDDVQIYWTAFLGLKTAKITFYPLKEKDEDK